MTVVALSISPDTYAVEGMPNEQAPAALLLDPSFNPANVRDISFAEAGRWVIEEITAIDLADSAAIRSRMDASLARLENLKACAVWPVSAHAHMQLVHQLSGFLMSEQLPAEDQDMSYDHAAQWAVAEVMKVNLRDEWAIAERLALAASKLARSEDCRKYPGSAHAHRTVVSELSVMLGRIRGTVH